MYRQPSIVFPQAPHRTRDLSLICLAKSYLCSRCESLLHIHPLTPSGTRWVSLPGEKDEISLLRVRNVTEQYSSWLRDPLVLFSICPGVGRGMERGAPAHGKGKKKNIREGKKQAMLAERRDRLSAARDGGHWKRCRASLADPLLPESHSQGKAHSHKQAWL